MWEAIVWKDIKITITNSAPNYYENQIFQKDHQHLHLSKISPEVVNNSTDMQVYNESEQQYKNLLVYYSKLLWLFIYFFDLLDWKNMNELE